MGLVDQHLLLVTGQVTPLELTWTSLVSAGDYKTDRQAAPAPLHHLRSSFELRLAGLMHRARVPDTGLPSDGVPLRRFGSTFGVLVARYGPRCPLHARHVLMSKGFFVR